MAFREVENPNEYFIYQMVNASFLLQAFHLNDIS